MKICVSSASGVESVTKRELEKLGYGQVPCNNGRFYFDGQFEDVAKCNLLLRTANRVYVTLSQFKVGDFDQLFDNVKEIAWEQFIDVKGKIDVVAKCVESTIHALSVTQSITKKAICERLSKRYGCLLDESGDRFKIEVAIIKDFCTISLDTSGNGLHRRGYRGLVGEAPIKETLASAIIQLSVWNKSRPLADLFCGSGTFAIEACLFALNIPSGLNRDFDFLHWKCFDTAIFNQVKEQALQNVIDYPLQITAFDIDDNQLKLARKHAQLAGVDKYIHFQKLDMRDFSSAKKYGVIITNPPYGERLSEVKEVEKLTKDFGKVFAKLNSWSCYTITPLKNFERLFGIKATKKRKLYNGPIECCLYAMLGDAPPKAVKSE